MEIQIKEGSATYDKVDEEHIIDFGIIPLDTHPTVVVRFRGNKVKNFVALPACGCTTVDTTVAADSVIDLKITYTATKERRPFSKVVKIMFKENGKQTNMNIKIKGNIL